MASAASVGVQTGWPVHDQRARGREGGGTLGLGGSATHATGLHQERLSPKEELCQWQLVSVMSTSWECPSSSAADADPLLPSGTGEGGVLGLKHEALGQDTRGMYM